jgi:glycosyltransferase involved in cell wall biosynthesis
MRSGSQIESSHMNLVAVTPYSNSDASSRARVHEWLTRTGIQSTRFVTGSPTNPKQLVRAVMAAQRNHGPVLVARHAHPLGQGIPEAALLRLGKPGVYDVDDGLPFDDGRLPVHGRWWKPLVAKSRIAHSAARSADRVIAGNERLAEWATKLCDHVVIVPTCVEPADYLTKTEYGYETPVVGWIGSPATEPHLFGIADALADAHRRTPFRLEIVSSGKRPLPTSIAGFSQRIQWTLDLQLSILAQWDIGVMPLPDRPYEQSKCAYKLLQYGAAALPVIGSPVGASATFLAKVDAPMPRSNAEWSKAIVNLLSETAARYELGNNANRVVNAEYSFDAWDSTWRTAVGFGV